jgi:hypothetical protein
MDRKIYLDLDGVLANFDKAAGAILGTDNIYKYEFTHGSEAFWAKMHTVKDVFSTFEPMDDAWDLMGAVGHLNVSILTALPKTNGAAVRRAKRKWVKEYWGDYPVITCFTKDKPNFCEPGSILVDDRTINRKAWEAKGGILIHHTSAADTITALRAIGVPVK